MFLPRIFRKLEDLAIPTLPHRYCYVAVTQCLQPGKPLREVVESAVRRSLIFLMTTSPPPANFDYALSRTLLLIDCLGQTTPGRWSSNAAIPPKLWLAWQWQSHLNPSSSDAKQREDARRHLAYNLYYALTGPILHPNGDLAYPPSVPPHIYITMVERLSTLAIFSFSDRSWPLLPGTYIEHYMNGHEALFTGLINFNDKAPYGKLLRGLVDVLNGLLSTPSFLENWASRNYESCYSRDKLQELYASVRLRCWVLMATILVNFTFEQLLVGVATGNAPGLDLSRRWAQNNYRWAALQDWIRGLRLMLKPSAYDARRLYIPRGKFQASVIALMGKLNDSLVMLEVPRGERLDIIKGSSRLVYEVMPSESAAGCYAFSLQAKRQVVRPGSTAASASTSPPTSLRGQRQGQAEVVEDDTKEEMVKDEMVLPPEEEGEEGNDGFEEKEDEDQVLGFCEAYEKEAEAVWAGDDDMAWPEGDERRGDEYKGVFLEQVVGLVKRMEKAKQMLEEVLVTEEGGLKKALVDDTWADAAVLKKDASDALDDITEDLYRRLQVRACLEACPTTTALTALLDEVTESVERMEETMAPAFRVVNKQRAKKLKRSASSVESTDG